MHTFIALALLLQTLSAQQTSDYLSGAGMGFGRSAESHGYPGPKHVLELSDKLGITAEQKSKLEASMKTMRETASRLGEQIVAKERELDGIFTSGAVDVETITALTTEIGRLQGRLRAVHLTAHIEGKRILTEEQIQKYKEERGHSGHH